MFEVTQEDLLNSRSQIVTSSWGGSRYAPFAFTERGVAMLSRIINIERAIEINISIIRAFIAMRQFHLGPSDLKERVSEIEKQFPDIYKQISKKDRTKIGYK